MFTSTGGIGWGEVLRALRAARSRIANELINHFAHTGVLFVFPLARVWTSRTQLVQKAINFDFAQRAGRSFNFLMRELIPHI